MTACTRRKTVCILSVAMVIEVFRIRVFPSFARTELITVKQKETNN